MSYTALSYLLLDSDILANVPLGQVAAIGAFILIGLFIYIRSVKKPAPTLSETVQTVATGQEEAVSHLTIEPLITDADSFSDDVIAAITAAIAASLKTSTSTIVIRNIKPVAQNVPVWGMMGRTEQVNSRF